VDRFRIITVDQ